MPKSNENPNRDLFGEPVADAKPKRRKATHPQLEILQNVTSAPETRAETVTFQLALPERYFFEGNMNGNPFRQLAFKAGEYEGLIEEFKIKAVSGFRFTAQSGQKLLIVSKKTSTLLGDEPVLLVPGATTIAGIQTDLKMGKGQWLSPKSRRIADLPEKDVSVICAETLESWKGKFTFRECTPAAHGKEAIPGLRRPQVGALHAALAHATSSSEPATIVMPTGTGKTETMLSVYAHQQIPRLMIIVPTDPLRDQIARKFETMGVLQDQKCFPADIRYPVVLRLEHIPKTPDQVDALFSKANVIVATIATAGRADPAAQERMAQMSGMLFIDEAHHISAKTWREFRACFMQAAEKKLIYQFTATPFREDGGKVDGKFIYYYPLRKAQEEGYFGQVEFRAVSEFEGSEADDEIVHQVAEVLARDLAAGHNHLAMARCKTIARAKELHALYTKKLPQYKPVIVHSGQSHKERQESLDKLRRFESRLIVCVDMLGEGFDLPELKIAALHDVFKSVAVTLQFVGRFTRARTDLGKATLIANTDQDRIDRALAKLYAEEADWNLLIATLSADRAGRAMDRASLFEGFQGDLTEIPLQTVEPSMNAIVFKTTDCTAWDPYKIEDCVPTGSFIGMKVNERERVAVCVLRHETQAKWTRSSAAIDVTWELLLAHWDEQKNMLYISSTGASVTDSVAAAICGEKTQRIRDQNVFRAFHDFRQLVIRNLGMTHRLGGGTRYSMLMGIDVNDGLDSLKKNERIQNNIFGSGFENGEPRNLGCSIKGKFWSQARVEDLTDWLRWCHRIGDLLTNESIPSTAAFAAAMRPTQITARPEAHPLVIHWPEGVLHSYEERVEIIFGDKGFSITECDITLLNHEKTGPLQFCVSSEDEKAVFEIQFRDNKAFYPQIGGTSATIKMPRRHMALSLFFEEDAPQIDFGDESFLIYSHHYVPPDKIDLKPLLEDRLTVWDWTGTDIRVESQGLERRADSIQYRVIQELKKTDLDIIFDDDGSGEFADVIGMKIRDGVVEVLLCHCKYSSADDPGSRVKDVYEVAGQALKSVQFCHKPKRFIRNLLKREKTRLANGNPSRFEVGTVAKLKQLHAQWDQYRFEYSVWIVQPGISKAAISDSVMHVLAFVEKSLIEHRRIPLQIILQP